MKKSTIIAPLISSTGLISAIAPMIVLTSCNKNNQYKITLDTQQQVWVNPGDFLILSFTLSKPLTQEYELTGPIFPSDADLHMEKASIGQNATWKISGTSALATINLSHQSGGYITAGKMVFGIKNKNTNETVSVAILTNFKVYWTD